MKTCPKCREAKPKRDFSKNRSSNDGLSSYCRQCKKASSIAKFRGTPSEKFCTKCRVVKSSSDFSPAANTSDRLYSSCRACKHAASRAAACSSPTPGCKRCSTCRETKAAVLFNRNRASRDGLKNECKPCANARARRHRAEGSAVGVKMKLRSLMTAAFHRRGYSKNTKTAALLGCSWNHLVEHLASLCYGVMTIEDVLTNDGRVHIDHIVPLSTAESEEDVVRLCHYTNLQPLWAADNLEKSDRLDWGHPRDR